MSSNGQFTNEMNVVSETTALVTMTGPHGTDILGCMVTVLAKYHARILDLEYSTLFPFFLLTYKPACRVFTTISQWVL